MKITPAQTEINLIMEKDRDEHLPYLQYVYDEIMSTMVLLRTLETTDPEAYAECLDLLTCYAIFGLEHISEEMGYSIDEVTGVSFEKFITLN